MNKFKNIRSINPEIHRLAKVAAASAGIGLNTWVELAIKEKIAKDK